MVKRDYSTGVARRKRGGKKPGKAAKGAILPKNLLFFISGMLFTLTATLYWYWAKQQGLPTTPSPGPKRELQPALPPKPRERWRYIKALESKQIRVMPPAPIPLSIQGVAAPLAVEKMPARPPFKAPQWLLQCDPLQPIEEAHALRASLALLGFEGSMIKEGKRQRVVLGPYPQRATAEKILRQLKQAQIAHCAITAAYH